MAFDGGGTIATCVNGMLHEGEASTALWHLSPSKECSGVGGARGRYWWYAINASLSGRVLLSVPCYMGNLERCESFSCRHVNGARSTAKCCSSPSRSANLGYLLSRAGSVAHIPQPERLSPINYAADPCAWGGVSRMCPIISRWRARWRTTAGSRASRRARPRRCAPTARRAPPRRASGRPAQ